MLTHLVSNCGEVGIGKLRYLILSKIGILQICALHIWECFGESRESDKGIGEPCTPSSLSNTLYHHQPQRRLMLRWQFSQTIKNLIFEQDEMVMIVSFCVLHRFLIRAWL